MPTPLLTSYYLISAAQAGEHEDDLQRTLTEEGRKDAILLRDKKLAHIRFDIAFFSPAARASQTGEILLEGQSPGVITTLPESYSDNELVIALQNIGRMPFRKYLRMNVHLMPLAEVFTIKRESVSNDMRSRSLLNIMVVGDGVMLTNLASWLSPEPDRFSICTDCLLNDGDYFKIDCLEKDTVKVIHAAA